MKRLMTIMTNRATGGGLGSVQEGYILDWDEKWRLFFLEEKFLPPLLPKL